MTFLRCYNIRTSGTAILEGPEPIPRTFQAWRCLICRGRKFKTGEKKHVHLILFVSVASVRVPAMRVDGAATPSQDANLLDGTVNIVLANGNGIIVLTGVARQRNYRLCGLLCLSQPPGPDARLHLEIRHTDRAFPWHLQRSFASTSMRQSYQ